MQELTTEDHIKTLYSLIKQIEKWQSEVDNHIASIDSALIEIYSKLQVVEEEVEDG